MNRDFLVEAALSALADLGEVRQKWVGTTLALVEAKREMKLAEAQARQHITKREGGPKAMGSNADLREHAMVIALAENIRYLKAQMEQDQASEEEMRAKQAMYTLDDTLKLFKVFLETAG